MTDYIQDWYIVREQEVFEIERHFDNNCYMLQLAQAEIFHYARFGSVGGGGAYLGPPLHTVRPTRCRVPSPPPLPQGQTWGMTDSGDVAGVTDPPPPPLPCWRSRQRNFWVMAYDPIITSHSSTVGSLRRRHLAECGNGATCRGQMTTGDCEATADEVLVPMRVNQVQYRAETECKGGGKRENLEITRPPAASSSTIPTCENPGGAPPEIEAGSPWWEASALATASAIASSRSYKKARSAINALKVQLQAAKQSTHMLKNIHSRLPTSVQSMSRQSQCSRVLQAPSRTVGPTRRFHALSFIQATNTSLAIVPQSPVVIPTALHSRTLVRRPPSRLPAAGLRHQSHQHIIASSLNISETLAGERRSVTPASLAAVGIHGIPIRGTDSHECIIPWRGEGGVGLRLRRGAAQSAPAAAPDRMTAVGHTHAVIIPDCWSDVEGCRALPYSGVYRCGDTATGIKCSIAAKHKAQNWDAVFSLQYVLLWDFQPWVYFETQLFEEEKTVFIHFGLLLNGISNVYGVLKAINSHHMKCVFFSYNGTFDACLIVSQKDAIGTKLPFSLLLNTPFLLRELQCGRIIFSLAKINPAVVGRENHVSPRSACPNRKPRKSEISMPKQKTTKRKRRKLPRLLLLSLKAAITIGILTNCKFLSCSKCWAAGNPEVRGFVGRNNDEERSVSLLASHQGEPGSIPGRFTPDFRKWESCRTKPLVGEFSRGPPAFPAPSFRLCSTLTSITLIGSQDITVNSRPNLFTHSISIGVREFKKSYNGTMHLRKSGVNRPGIEPGSSWWEASRLTAHPAVTDITCTGKQDDRTIAHQFRSSRVGDEALGAPVIVARIALPRIHTRLHNGAHWTETRQNAVRQSAPGNLLVSQQRSQYGTFHPLQRNRRVIPCLCVLICRMLPNASTNRVTGDSRVRIAKSRAMRVVTSPLLPSPADCLWSTSPDCTTRTTHNNSTDTMKIVRKSGAVHEASVEQRRNGRVGVNERYRRKPADQRHRPPRFPLANIREQPGRR
ncbi:hypothetical protein PR048_007276 [Dryococelus australis]|uniref:Uncharacterized protein n=1 Tax=Dryococelus australis TaxID=614101 RepID=A0ABQ9ID71_9NEOP|nr:hypothetical protein PR048_007276 [Dryococelus australis]